MPWADVSGPRPPWAEVYGIRIFEAILMGLKTDLTQPQATAILAVLLGQGRSFLLTKFLMIGELTKFNIGDALINAHA